jgi:hypothetical protein
MYKDLLIHIMYLMLLYMCMKESKQMVVMSAVRALLEADSHVCFLCDFLAHVYQDCKEIRDEV